PAPSRQNRIDIEVLLKLPGMVAVQQKMLVGWSLWQRLHKTHRAYAKPASWFLACRRGRSCAGRVKQVSSTILPRWPTRNRKLWQLELSHFRIGGDMNFTGFSGCDMSWLTSPTEFRACVFSTLSHSRIRIYDHFSLDIAGPQLYTEAQSIEGVASAMRYIEDPRQERLFDPYQGLFPPLARRILENGWQGTFRLAILETLPVGKLSEHFHPSLGTHTKELYSMAGLVFLADFHGWTT